tara:strand:+ start:1058 stop:1219 length:162 start_codon:yes stop_codon:yes gene_type:complete
MLKKTDELREALINLAWDCHSQWIDDDGVETWADSQVEETAKNIIDSLTKEKK